VEPGFNDGDSIPRIWFDSSLDILFFLEDAISSLREVLDDFAFSIEQPKLLQVRNIAVDLWNRDGFSDPFGTFYEHESVAY
jgi:hypothetical protein